MGQFLATFKDYPQRQKAASFNMDEVMQKLKEPQGIKARSTATPTICGRPCPAVGRSKIKMRF